MLTFIRKHLVWKTVVLITASIAVISTISATYFYNNYKKQMISQFYREIEDIKNIIEGGYPVHIWNIQHEVIKHLNETILSGMPYVAIFIYEMSIDGEYVLNLSTTKREFENRNEYIHEKSDLKIEEKHVERTHGFIAYNDKTIGKYELYQEFNRLNVIFFENASDFGVLSRQFL
ncbi:hypothetical protein [Desulfonatronum sp. SC1]|uniref:hypothetical protein n=1 Tax=Desulfonatronum sp. SC1 TaxID=2109626 RepID=UPI000D2FCE0B|nr:hypothetical protein [Desulfonatronum sp. SC1]PTN33912.1 hypothetical protein C6366_13570 [Desulfonatronum sp. SC1]